jgi:tRNA U34 2-thiouridine synthase MnmA/TrmU
MYGVNRVTRKIPSINHNTANLKRLYFTIFVLKKPTKNNILYIPTNERKYINLLRTKSVSWFNALEKTSVYKSNQRLVIIEKNRKKIPLVYLYFKYTWIQSGINNKIITICINKFMAIVQGKKYFLYDIYISN